MDTKSLERFYRNIEFCPASGCWLWTGSTSGPLRNYGQMNINFRKKRVHRLVYEHFIGSIPDGMLVLHKCDVGLCCNPNHLYLGDYIQNAKDKIERHPNPNEGSGERKLSDEQICQMRKRHHDGEKQIDLALKFKVAPGYVSRIVNGKTKR